MLSKTFHATANGELNRTLGPAGCNVVVGKSNGTAFLVGEMGLAIAGSVLGLTRVGAEPVRDCRGRNLVTVDVGSQSIGGGRGHDKRTGRRNQQRGGAELVEALLLLLHHEVFVLTRPSRG